MKSFIRKYKLGIGFIVLLIMGIILVPVIFGKNVKVDYDDVRGFSDCVIDLDGSITEEPVYLEPRVDVDDSSIYSDTDKYEVVSKSDFDTETTSDGNGYLVPKDKDSTYRIFSDGTVAKVKPEDKKDPSKPEDKKDPKEDEDFGSYITLNINCVGIYDNTNKDDGRLPVGGQILTAKVKITDGETLDNVLYRVCSSLGLECSNPTGNYVDSMDNLSDGGGIQQALTDGNFACPGWMYQYNGWYPNFGLSYCSVFDGDTIIWNYDAWKLDLSGFKTGITY